jgi:hypothetical protein
MCEACKIYDHYLFNIDISGLMNFQHFEFKLFVENIDNIPSDHHSESRFEGITDITFNQMPIS